MSAIGRADNAASFFQWFAGSTERDRAALLSVGARATNVDRMGETYNDAKGDGHGVAYDRIAMLAVGGAVDYVAGRSTMQGYRNVKSLTPSSFADGQALLTSAAIAGNTTSRRASEVLNHLERTVSGIGPISEAIVAAGVLTGGGWAGEAGDDYEWIRRVLPGIDQGAAALLAAAGAMDSGGAREAVDAYVQLKQVVPTLVDERAAVLAGVAAIAGAPVHDTFAAYERLKAHGLSYSQAAVATAGAYVDTAPRRLTTFANAAWMLNEQRAWDGDEVHDARSTYPNVPSYPGGGYTAPGDDHGYHPPGGGNTSPGDDFSHHPIPGGNTSPGDDYWSYPDPGSGTSSGDSTDNGNPDWDDF